MIEDKNNLPELPKGWVLTRLGEVLDVSSGYGFPKKYQGKLDGDLPFFKVGDISKTVLDGNMYLGNAENYISFDECEEINAQPLKRGTIVFAKIGEAIKLNRRAILNQPSLVDNNVMGIHSFSNGLNNLFIYYFLLTIKLGDYSRATTVPSVRKTDVENILFPLPPLPAQQRIVAKIEELFTKLDTGVKALKKIKTQLKLYRQSVLKSAMEGKLTEKWRRTHKDELEPASVLLEKIKEERKKKLGKKYKELPPVDTENSPKLPEGWCWTRLGEACLDPQYGWTTSAVTEGILHLLRTTDITSGSIDWNTVPFCKEEPSEKEKYLLKDGDIVISRAGSVGYSHLIKNPKEAIFASYLIRFRPLIDEKYLAFFIKSPSYWNSILEKSLGIAIPNVNASKLKQISIPLPPLSEQHKIVEEIEKRFSIADEVEKTVEQSLKQSERLRQSILKRAFEGKLLPQGPTDEAANVLLERIKKEKEKLDAERKSKRKSRKKKHKKYVQKGLM